VIPGIHSGGRHAVADLFRGGYGILFPAKRAFSISIKSKMFLGTDVFLKRTKIAFGRSAEGTDARCSAIRCGKEIKNLCDKF